MRCMGIEPTIPESSIAENLQSSLGPGYHAPHGNLIEGSDQYYYVPGFLDSLVYFPAVAYF